MPALRIHWLQHVPFEGLGQIEPWAHRHGHTLHCTRLHADEPLPPPQDFDWLIIMGGPMGAYESDLHPFLSAEIDLIRVAIRTGKRVLGICLGAQLMAAALGARVYASGHKEIGWFPVEAVPEATHSPFGDDLPDPLTVFHWHGDTFDLPAGAVRLARSALFQQQGFAYGDRVLALQFHPEMDAAGLAALTDAFGVRLKPRPGVQSAAEMCALDHHFAPAQRLLEAWLTRLART
ncbi:MAG: type 1 glutamine amidotransferase [Immundisolibacter sp.]|uniref:type 1 glutamine amidotransferase n=1 Tax=Immundisolibacter sp. TaxID=1934948 RepID=UPI003EE047CD